MAADSDTVPDEPAEGAGEPSASDEFGKRNRHRAGVRGILLVALVLLLSILVAVIWILPRHVEPVIQLEEEEPPSVQSEPEPPTESETTRARFERDAENVLQEFLKMQAALEAQEVAVWGGPEYEQTLQELARADASFANEDFEQAKSGYETAAGMLEALENSRPERLRQALSSGAAALGLYDRDAALRQYQIALALEPGNEQALAGVDRAGKLEQLSALLDKAGQAEENDDLTAAHQLLQQAVALDPLDPRAEAGLDRVSALIEDRRFGHLMSEALTAVDGGRFDAAGDALSAADAMRPGTPEVADARGRLALAMQKQKIDAHRRRAEKFEQAENWHEVVSELDAVLAIDPQAQFAVQGLEQGRRLAALHDQLDAWLRDPERLRSQQPRENARTLLDSPASTSDSGTRLQQKTDQLAALLVLAETPVSVSLVSDALTEVTINQVGRFGTFSEQTVTLLPGRYVVRGERAGYRDVRLELNVNVGTTTPPLVVRCEEKI